MYMIFRVFLYLKQELYITAIIRLLIKKYFSNKLSNQPKSCLCFNNLRVIKT